MSFPRLLLAFSVLLFGFIGAAALLKGKVDDESAPISGSSGLVQELDLAELQQQHQQRSAQNTPFVEVDRIDELFRLSDPRFPIVETVTYSSRVPWKKGRAAWVADYAAHYDTSRHFIARSLNQGPEYKKQDVRNGDRFNVLRTDVDIEFHLVVDITDAKMQFYYVNQTDGSRELVKTYDVGLGRPDSRKASGILTPLGTYLLGGRFAVYEPGKMGSFRNETTEMVRVFGTRWIPFEKEIANTSEPARGFGIHGAPWEEQSPGGSLEPDHSSIGGFDSDGCIRMATDDMEELFAVIISRPTYVHLVREFGEEELPGSRAPQEA